MKCLEISYGDKFRESLGKTRHTSFDFIYFALKKHGNQSLNQKVAVSEEDPEGKTGNPYFKGVWILLFYHFNLKRQEISMIEEQKVCDFYKIENRKDQRVVIVKLEEKFYEC